MFDPFDPKRFQLPPNLTSPPKPKRKPPRFCEEPFLRGPISWVWLLKAMALPGRALAVALVLRREAGIRQAMTFTLSQARLRETGISRYASWRGLRALETAGLVAMQRPSGRCLEVTILEAPAPERNGQR
jgi:hypothetical protein